MLRRTKSRWFARERARDPATLASAVAFSAWRLGVNAIKRMRAAKFSIDADAGYFAVLAEYLSFLVQVADRLVQRRCDAEARAEFVTAMCRRLADLLADNRAELLGDERAAVRQAFFDLHNQRAEEYAPLGEPGRVDFELMRYAAHQLLAHFGDDDRAWVVDQVVSFEAPEAVATLAPLVDNLVATAPGSAIT